jgi:hypothetical protein
VRELRPPPATRVVRCHRRATSLAPCWRSCASRAGRHRRRDVAVGPGLTVITGETGAGKTMVVAGWAALRGRPTRPGARRPGRAVVDGRLRLTGDARPRWPTARRRGRRGRRRRQPAAHRIVTPRAVAGARRRAHRAGRAAGRDRGAGCRRARPVRPAAAAAPGRAAGALDRFAGAEHEKQLAAFRESHGAWVRITEDLAQPPAQRPRAPPGGRPAPARPRRDHTGRPAGPAEDEALREEAQRLEHAEGLRAAVQSAYLSPRRQRQRRGLRRRQPALRPSGARSRASPASTGLLGEYRGPGRRGDHAGAGARLRSRRLPRRPGRRPGPAGRRLRAAGGPSRA